MSRSALSLLSFSLLLALLVPARASAQPRFKLDEVQASLAVQGLDGWLLADSQGRNAVAVDLVNPRGKPEQTWFYWIPQSGEPTLIFSSVDGGRFSGLPGAQVVYSSDAQLKGALKKMLRGSGLIAMEYAPKSGIPQLTRVDDATVALVKSAGPKIASSAQLVQFTKSIWGVRGRIAHYIVSHHLSALRKLALAHLAKQILAGVPVSEYDLQQFILRGMEARGVVGSVVVASGIHTSNPRYATPATGGLAIARGELVSITAWGRMQSEPRAIYANTTWMAYVGGIVPQQLNEMFANVVRAREAAVALIRDRLARRRAVRGFEVDQAARKVLTELGLDKHFTHRTGHSLDTSVQGDGANLESLSVRDTRNLVAGTGFTIEPGVYFTGKYGMRSEINAFIGPKGLEVTTPEQQEITAILPRR